MNNKKEIFVCAVVIRNNKYSMYRYCTSIHVQYLNQIAQIFQAKNNGVLLIKANSIWAVRRVFRSGNLDMKYKLLQMGSMSISLLVLMCYQNIHAKSNDTSLTCFVGSINLMFKIDFFHLQVAIIVVTWWSVILGWPNCKTLL